MFKKNYNWNPSSCVCENSRYLKSIVEYSVVVCDEIISVMDSVSANVTNTISTNTRVLCHVQDNEYFVNKFW